MQAALWKISCEDFVTYIITEMNDDKNEGIKKGIKNITTSRVLNKHETIRE